MTRQVHFVGIGGIGMSGLARILLKKGNKVTGSDVQRSGLIKKLIREGIRIFIGHKKENIKGADLIVVSSAIPSGNPEIMQARKKGVNICSRAEMLARLGRKKTNILVSGSHGKTTTTSMIALMLEKNRLDPLVAIGGELEEFGGNMRMGEGNFFVAEADESDGSFLKLKPDIAVLTNIEAEHLDYYAGIKEIRQAFIGFLKKISPGGRAILCLDDKNSKEIFAKEKNSLSFLTYAIYDPRADLRAQHIKLGSHGSSFKVFYKGKTLGTFYLNVPGRHNVYNGLAAIATGLLLKIKKEKIALALRDFSGVMRRFQRKGKERGICVIDDYAHHPTEIKACLEAARKQKKKRIIAVFQPHRYTRTKFFAREFAHVLSAADRIILVPVYAAGERPIPDSSAETILSYLEPSKAIYLSRKASVAAYLLKVLRRDDLVLTIGAGDVYKIGEALLKKLK